MRKSVFCACFLSFQFIHAQQDFNDTIATRIFEPIKVFPNPTSEILFIRNGEQIDSYQLINMQGEVVQSGKNEAQIISLIEHPIGHYFLLIEIDGYHKRFRVQKY